MIRSSSRSRVWRRLPAAGLVLAATITPLAFAGPASAKANFCTAGDTVPPQITGVTLGAQSVDLSTGAESLAITIDATDTAAGTASGVTLIRVEADGPSRDESVAYPTLTSGTADNGVWTGAFKLPRSSISGGWHLRLLEVKDHAQNIEYYIRDGKHPEAPTDPRLQLGWQQTFTVTGSATSQTLKPGKLTEFGFATPSVDTKQAAKTVGVTAAFAPPRPRHVSVYLRGNVADGRNFFVKTKLTRTTGDHWGGQIPIRQWAGDSKAHAQLVVRYGADVRPRYRFFYPRELRALHFPAALTITSGLDTAKPVLSAFSFTPSAVNTTNGPKTITIHATPTDTQSGVVGVYVRFFIRAGRTAVEGDPFVRLTPNGTDWTGQLKIPGCVTPGDWEPGVYVLDAAGRHRDYERKALVAASLPADLTVTSTPVSFDPPFVTNATASGADHTITLDFNEGVKNVTASTLTVFAAKPAASRFEHPLTISGITCSNGSNTTNCSGGGGLATSATLDVPAVKGGKSYQVWANLNAVTSQLTNGVGYPMDWDNTRVGVTGS